MLKQILRFFNIREKNILAINYEKFYTLNKKKVRFVKYYIKLDKTNINHLLYRIGFNTVHIPI